ncbi:hypothetical protein B0J18DRAFT_301466 [Chaetomium sp. MPI-SDFR-AT-0129]|nr:hypothetical protein B0J18DRAFT_301466 [Chaetomium sp. MPI-SDFR-AT-0129]
MRYELSPAELTTLLQNSKKDSKGRRVYETTVAFPPTRDTETFARMANIRLNQVRVWLPGARRKPETGGHRQILQVSISHLGHETLWDPNATNYDFNHEPVDLQFSYDTSQVDAIDDCLPSLVFGRQAIENDYVSGDVSTHTVAPIGPLGEWTIGIREGDNEGLDLSRVTGVWMEFCGRNMPFHKPEGPGKVKN